MLEGSRTDFILIREKTYGIITHVKKMCLEYGIDEKRAEEDADTFLKTLEEVGALQ